MSVKHALLGILARAPKHGYELKRDFEDKLGEFWELNFGQIYTTLERLQTEGCVQHDPVSQDDRPDKKVYSITERGLTEFRDWRTSDLKAEPRALRDELFLRLLFMEDEDIDFMRQIIQRHIKAYLAHMMRLTDRKVDVEQAARRARREPLTDAVRGAIERERLVQLTLLDAAIMHTDADINWLRQCDARLTDLHTARGTSS
jgi:DNA-binding PadR family transcriptional regulator